MPIHLRAVPKIQMPENQKQIWINIRAELIVRSHEKKNPNMFHGGYSIEYAKRIAANQLRYDLIMGELRISLDDLLLYAPDECLAMLENQKMARVREMIEKTQNKSYEEDVD